ncbi:MAG TPA: alpha/beta fold hydrolase [Pseudolabrys sp.]|jgi:2,6-dihydroxypseudooxynicotine hydrolase|nr:alpha/beta fold hydrolase [Pseudolabrys sp.]
MSSDAQVQAAIAHWGPRFVANGVVLTDFEEITGKLTSYDQWCAAWSERAAHHEQLGRDALKGGYELTAAECLQRAAIYYHFASFLFVHDVPQMKVAHMKGVACRQAALPFMRPAGERVTIPYEGKSLAGILRKPAGVQKPPIVVMAVGLDSTKEEGEAYEMPFLARGIATLIFDGPGQGEGQYDFAIRGDYEVAVKAVIDYVESRGDLDGSRIGMWGVSLGGYYAPRATAFEKRIKACIALGGPFDWAAAFDALPELTREAFRVRSHCKTQEEAKKNAATLSLVGVAQNITCPIYIVNGRNDRIVPAADAERLAREVKGPVDLMIVEDGNHIATNRAYRWRSQSADWMKKKLG